MVIRFCLWLSLQTTVWLCVCVCFLHGFEWRSCLLLMILARHLLCSLHSVGFTRSLCINHSPVFFPSDTETLTWRRALLTGTQNVSSTSEEPCLLFFLDFPKLDCTYWLISSFYIGIIMFFGPNGRLLRSLTVFQKESGHGGLIAGMETPPRRSLPCILGLLNGDFLFSPFLRGLLGICFFFLGGGAGFLSKSKVCAL